MLKGWLRAASGVDRLAVFPPREPARRGTRTLLAGWFSWRHAGATAGDLIARDLVAGWLEEAGHTIDIANAPPFVGGVNWRKVDPGEYDHVVFVCGPFARDAVAEQFLERFSGARQIGVNLTMIEPLDAWQPFDRLWERDSSRTARPDLTLLAQSALVPVLGVCLVEAQPEHSRGMHAVADAAIERLVARREAAVIRIDTRLDSSANQLRTPAEVESMVARVDVLLTTRLHGTVLAIKNGVPALAVDPIGGGAKVKAQAGALGWSQCFVVDEIDDVRLSQSLDWCLTAEARQAALACRERAISSLATVRDEFVDALRR